jgi:hypothetical protein
MKFRKISIIYLQSMLVYLYSLRKIAWMCLI